MKKSMLMATVALIFSGSAVFAQVDPAALAAAYQAEGYGRVEVTVGPNDIRVEAVNGGSKVEVVYDRETGEILASEQGRANLRDRMRNGVEINETDDNDQGDDHGGRDDGEDNGNDDGEDHDSGDDNGGDHDGGDDNGGDHDGGDHDGGDHDGGDHDGGDHDGGDHDGGDHGGSDD